MFKRKHPRIPLGAGEAVRFSGRVRLHLMAETRAFVYLADYDGDDEELVAVGTGSIEVDVTAARGLIYVKTEDGGRVWADRQAVDQQVVLLNPSKFTTLDRPPPMSPEMAAMQRLMRQNSIERERMLDEMRKVQSETREAAALVQAERKVNAKVSANKRADAKVSVDGPNAVDGSDTSGRAAPEDDGGEDGF